MIIGMKTKSVYKKGAHIFLAKLHANTMMHYVFFTENCRLLIKVKETILMFSISKFLISTIHLDLNIPIPL